MKNRFKFFGIAVFLTAIGFSMTGCAAAPDAFINRAGWSYHPLAVRKDHVIVGAIVVRNTTRAAVLGDLMDRAIAMGGHDIIHVRLTTPIGAGRTGLIDVATAVVIRYTDETVKVPVKVSAPEDIGGGLFGFGRN